MPRFASQAIRVKTRQFNPLQVAGLRLFHNDGFSVREITEMFNLRESQVNIAVHDRGCYVDVETVAFAGSKCSRREARYCELRDIDASIARCKTEPKYRARAWRVVRGTINAAIVFPNAPIDKGLRLCR